MDKNSKKCASCGGNLFFSPKHNALLCEKCGNLLEILVDKTQQIEKHNIDNEENLNNELAVEQTYNCTSCGAISISGLKFSNTCAYCGSNTVINVSSNNAIKCDAIIPFKIDKSDLKEVYARKVKYKFLVPNKLKKCPDNSKIEAFYIPSFSFDALTFNTYKGRLSKTVKDSDGHSHSKHFNIAGNKEVEIKDNLIESSIKLNQVDLDNIKPFNIKESLPYNSDFIRGYSVEHYDNSLRNCYNLSRVSMKKIIEEEILSKYDYDYVEYLNIESKFSQEKYCYYILPVYKLNFNYKNKNYTTFINGQTGKIGAGLPKSKVKITFLTLFIILFFALFFILPIIIN